MRLYLASYAKNTINEIIKNEKIDPKGKTAIFIPTAGDPYDNKDFVEADKKALLDAGFEVTELDIKKGTKKLKILAPDTDLILVAGGDTFYLIDHLRRTGADKILQEYVSNGGLYVGSSAGSIICCPTIEGAVEFDNPNLAPDLEDYTGLNIFPDVIIPHAHKEKYFERINRASAKLNQKYRVYHLTDDEVLFYDGKNAEVF